MSSPVKKHFRGMSREHGVKTFLKVGSFEAVSDDGRDVKAALQEVQHLVPSAKYLTAIDALDLEHFEDYKIPVHVSLWWQDSK